LLEQSKIFKFEFSLTSKLDSRLLEQLREDNFLKASIPVRSFIIPPEISKSITASILFVIT